MRMLAIAAAAAALLGAVSVNASAATVKCQTYKGFFGYQTACGGIPLESARQQGRQPPSTTPIPGAARDESRDGGGGGGGGGGGR
jgi:hypothetical protein